MDKLCQGIAEVLVRWSVPQGLKTMITRSKTILVKAASYITTKSGRFDFNIQSHFSFLGLITHGGPTLLFHTTSIKSY